MPRQALQMNVFLKDIHILQNLLDWLRPVISLIKCRVVFHRDPVYMHYVYAFDYFSWHQSRDWSGNEKWPSVFCLRLLTFFHTSIELNYVQWWAKRRGKVSRQRKEKQNSTSYSELLATRTSCGRDGSAWSLWHTLTEPHQTFRFLLFCFPNFLRLENTPCLSFISLSSWFSYAPSIQAEGESCVGCPEPKFEQVDIDLQLHQSLDVSWCNTAKATLQCILSNTPSFCSRTSLLFSFFIRTDCQRALTLILNQPCIMDKFSIFGVYFI